MATTLTIDNLNVAAGTFYDRHLNSAAALDADKMQHCYKVSTVFNLATTGTPVTSTQTLYVASQAGTLREFKSMNVAAGSSASMTYDLQKNGVSVLSAVNTHTNADSANQVKTATITTASFSAGDVFKVVLTVSSSTGATGPFATAAFEENAAP